MQPSWTSGGPDQKDHIIITDKHVFTNSQFEYGFKADAILLAVK